MEEIGGIAETDSARAWCVWLDIEGVAYAPTIRSPVLVAWPAEPTRDAHAVGGDVLNSDRVFELVVPLLRGTARRRRQARRESFSAETIPPRAIVFLGDSLTEAAPLDELFAELPVVNRGIGWDTSLDLLERVDEAVIDPAVVSVLIGTNDLHTSRSTKDPRGIVIRVETIVDRVRASAPGARVLVNGLLPRSALYAPRLQALNAQYRVIAELTGSTYVDAWPALADSDGALRKEFTTDNLHLSPAGYAAWGRVLRPLLTPNSE